MPETLSLSLQSQKIYCEFESAPHYGFRSRNEDLKDFGDSGSEDYSFPFREAIPKLTSYSDIPYPNPHFRQFLVATVNFGSFYVTEPYLSPAGAAGPGWKSVRFSKSARRYPLIPRNVFRI